MSNEFLLPDEEARLTQAAVPQEQPVSAFVLPGEIEQRDAVLNASLRQAVPVNPDQQAKVVSLSGATGISADVISRNEAAVAEQARVRELQQLMQDSPILARQMTDPSFAKLAHDDAENLSTVERIAKTFKGSYLGASAISGVYNLIGAGATLAESLNPFTTSEGELATLYKSNPDEFKRMQRDSAGAFLSRLARSQQEAGALAMEGLSPEARSDYGGLRYATTDTRKAAYLSPVKMAGDALNSLPSTLALMLSAYVTKGAGRTAYAEAIAAGAAPEAARSAAIAAAAATMARVSAISEGAVGYAQQKNQTLSAAEKALAENVTRAPDYQRLIAEGYAPETAMARIAAITAEQSGLSAGVVDALTNLVGGRVLGKIIGEGGAILPRIAKGGAVEGAQEFVQSGLEQVGQNLALQANINPAQSLTDDVLENALQGLAVGGLTGGAVSGVFGGASKAQAAVEDAQVLAQFAEAAKLSKLLGRDPASFERLVQEAAAEGPVHDVYIDAKTFAQIAQDKGLDIAKLAPSAAAQLEDALATTGDLRIPIGEYAAGIAATDTGAALLQHLRTSPDAMSQAEAQTFMQSHADQFKAEAEKILAAHEFSTAIKQSAATVENEILAQLKTANRFTDDVNRPYAALMSSFYKVQAARFGMTPEQMYVSYPLQIQAESALPGGRVLEQPGGTRGQISFGEDITKQPSIISLLNGADLSTLLHEMGHFQLEVLTHLASQPGAPGAVIGDVNALLTWFGIGSFAEWQQMPLEQKRTHHEQFARGFEAYLFEGKSPNVELQGVFARFRAWLINVYKQLTALNVQLTDEVRGVFDRLIATNDQILEAEAARGYAPLFKSAEQAGMTAAEWQAYQEQNQDATQEAVDQLQSRSLRNMQWLTNARGRVLGQLQRDAGAKRKAVHAEVQAEVRQQPVYAAQRFLRYGELPTGEKVVGAKLDLAALKEMYGEDPAAPWRYLSTGEHGLAGNAGLHPDAVADMFPGFTTGDQLVREILGTPPEATLIEGMTDQRMLERYGDLSSPEALSKATDAAIHNEARAKFVATELNALAKATGQARVLASAAKEFAGAIVGRQKVRELRPLQYAAAEARAAKAAEKAIARDNLVEAATEKRNELVNHYAAKAAYEAQAEIEQGVEFFRRVVRGVPADIAKTRDVDVVMAARAILAEYGIGTKGKAAHEYLKSVQTNDPAMFEVLRDRIDALMENAKNFDVLTVDEFRALKDEIGAMWHLARRSRQMEVDGDLMDRQDVETALRDRMEEIGIPDTVPGEGHAVTDGERRLAMLQTARAALRRVESWVGVKDGSAPMGPFRRYVWQQVKDAADKYRASKAKHLRQYRTLLDAIAPTLKPERIAAPELGYTFGYSRGGSGMAEILHAILHTGNASNKKKLLMGRNWAVERPDGSIDTSRWDSFIARMIAEKKLTKVHFDFAQGVWNLLEETKPLAQKAHRDVFGYYFAEVTAEPFSTPFGAYQGGYVPALADPEVVTDAKTRALMEEDNSTLAFAFPATARGFTKSRVEYNRPLLLDLRVLSQHIDKVLLFSHLEQPIRDVRRVLTAKGVAYALNRIDPAAFDGLLTPWLNRTARQQVETPIPGSGGLMRFFSAARSRAGMAAMFANVSNTVQQITGMSTALVKVRPKLLLSATADFVRHPSDFVRAVSESSTYMNTRMENEVAQMTDAINSILLNPSVYEKAQAWTMKHAYFLQAAVDNVIGPIVWTGAYNQAIEQGVSELDAKRLADGVVRETQGSVLPEEISRIESGNAFVRMFTQFAGYFNTQANMLGSEFAKISQGVGLKAGAGRGFYVLLFGMLAPAWGAEFITQIFRGGPGDDDKDGEYLDDWIAAVFGFGTLRYLTAMVPVVGQVVNAGVNTLNTKPYDDRISTAPAISMIESAVRAPQSVYKAIAAEGRPGKAVKDVATLLSLVLGIPASAAARPISYLADVESGNVSPANPIDAARGTITGAPGPR